VSCVVGDERHGSVGRFGDIPVRNLWLLMLYASDLFQEFEHAKRSIEDNLDDIPELIAEMLCCHVERRIQRNLSYGYRAKDETGNRVRGRINILQTEAHHLLAQGRVAYRFDELTVNTARNCYVRAALNKLSAIVEHKNLAHRCRTLALRLQRMGVIGDCPSRAEIFLERIGRHDAGDRLMMFAAHLAFNLALPTETPGTQPLSSPHRDIHWVRQLYEKGIAGFYKVVLGDRGWRVATGKTIHWFKEDQSAGIERILPTMRIDIVLDNLAEGRRIIIDTKFNAMLTRGWYRKETLRSNYLYQIYAYLRTQESVGDSLANNATGLLLHPSVGNDVFETVTIQGHKMVFATVDLAQNAKEIRERLLEVVGYSCSAAY